MTDDVQNAISAAGKAEAEAELAELRDVRRPQIAAAIKAAREEGDLSENAEYHAAREEQGMNEARIRTLEALLAHVTVVEPTNGDTAGTGSVVSFKEEGSGEVTEVTLVHRLEADPAEGKLSVESPIGKALLGVSPGDAVTVPTPNGERRLQVVEVG